jgi:histidinol-phosphate/aromatic aminotransferase/cobyric acid decarboxylase-like protein
VVLLANGGRHQRSAEEPLAVNLDKYVCKPVYGFMHSDVEHALYLSDYAIPEKFRFVADGQYERYQNRIIDRFVDWVRPEADLLPFAYRYPTMGSEEAIREIMTYLREVENADRIYTLRGEYEGYKAVAGTRGLPTVALDYEELIHAPPGFLFLSNPSARDGNVLTNHAVNKLATRHRTILDLAYIGTAPLDEPIDTCHAYAVLTSFSKPFGMFYYRVGFAFARTEIPSLWANKMWFKSVLALDAADAVIRSVDRAALLTDMRRRQSLACAEIKDATGVMLTPSDSFLLAHADPETLPWYDDDLAQHLAQFRRADTLRFCLTPSFESQR